MTSATAARPRPSGPGREPAAAAEQWAAGYLATDDADRPLVDAAVRCIARWGIRKTSLDDIAREAGVSRATVYRAFPGGKDRLVEVVIRHEAGRILHDIDAELASATRLDQLVLTGVTGMLRLAGEHPVLGSVVRYEPELILPHFAFHQLDRVLALADELCRPHLSRFLPADDVRPAADLLARVVLTFAFRPTPWVDPYDPASMRRLVHTYLMPALAPQTDHSVQETP